MKFRVTTVVGFVLVAGLWLVYVQYPSSDRRSDAPPITEKERRKDVSTGPHPRVVPQKSAASFRRKSGSSRVRRETIGTRNDHGFPHRDSVINRLEVRVSSFQKRSPHYYALKFLVGKFNRAKNYMNPHLMPNFEGIIFGDSVSVHEILAPALGDAWVMTLQELGCELTQQQISDVKSLVENTVELNQTTAEALVGEELSWDEEKEAYRDLNAAQTDIYFGFLEQMSGVIEGHNFSRLCHFFEELSLRTVR